MSIENALAEIGRCSGTHFDPRLAGLFCAIPTAQIRELVQTERENRLPDFRLLQEAA
jgi:HD-GYP domain-containing protein (c-di-GMP phosphodiesterase class II)